MKPAPLPAPRTFGRFNGRAVWTLLGRDVRRFWRSAGESLGGPIISSLLFLAVFVLALGGEGKVAGGLSFVQFVAPGIAMYAALYSGFFNGATPVVYDKHEGTIQDILAAPVSALEIAAGYGLSATSNALVTGLAVLVATMPFVALPAPQLPLAALFAVAGVVAFGLIGVLIGLWADKWDHYSAAESFLILPLGVLSGAFFPLDSLPDLGQVLILFNPAFHAIDGVRYGLTGAAAWSPGASLAILLVFDLALAVLAWRLIDVGYKIKP